MNANMGVRESDFKTGSTFDNCGWKDKAHTKFVSGARIFEEIVVDGKPEFKENACIFTDSENTNCDKKLIKAGSVEGWVNAVRPLLYNTRMRFTCYKELDTIISEFYDAKQCTYIVIGDSTKGKTLGMQITASQVGNPDETTGLIVSGDISTTAFIANMRTLGNHMVHIDETTNMKEDMKKSIGYIATNGVEPERDPDLALKPATSV